MTTLPPHVADKRPAVDITPACTSRQKKPRKHPALALLIVFVLLGLASFAAGLLAG